MKQRITDIIKTFGENDGICSRIDVNGLKHDGRDILSVIWHYEDERLKVFLQDENDRYTEWFDCLPYLTQIQICADVENSFGTEFDNKVNTEPIKTNADMEKKIKREMLLEMMDYALKHDADGMRNLYNEVVCLDGSCTRDFIETNDEDGLKRLFENYSTYEIVKIVADGYYNPNDTYATICNGELWTFKNIEDYFDKEFVADFLMAKEDSLNLNDFFCKTCGNDGYYAYCDIFIKYYLRFNAETTERKVRNAVVDVFNDWNNFLYFSWDELNDNVRSSTKEDVFDDMRNLLKNTDDKIIFFDDDNCKINLYYFGETIEHLMVNVRLVKDREGNDVIIQDADILIDGEVIREIDNVMHLSFEEMKALYELMEQNIY